MDLNEYNHITATYFLLAERKLRAQRADLANSLRMRVAQRDLHMVASAPSAAAMGEGEDADG